MTPFLSVLAAAIVFAVLGFVLREVGWRGVPLFFDFCTLFLLSGALSFVTSVREVLDTVNGIPGLAESTAAALRIVGVGCLSSWAADTCRDMQAEGVARAITVVARFEMITVCLPFFRKIIEVGCGLLS